MKAVICVIIILLNIGMVQADDATQARYENLLKTYRCVTCPNQNIGDSSAPIAKAMREDILQRIKLGHTDAQIQQFLVSRYGEYVNYKPAVNKSTSVLWFGPFIVFLIGIGFWYLPKIKRV